MVRYDLKILAEHPKFGKSIVRLFNSYSKVNKIQQAVFYGDLFLELDQETRDKFKGTQITLIFGLIPHQKFFAWPKKSLDLIHP